MVTWTVRDSFSWRLGSGRISFFIAMFTRDVKPIWLERANQGLAQFLEFLPFSLGGKVLGDFEMLGLRFSIWEETMSCFQVKSKYLNTKTQFWQAVEIWIVSECASRGKNCEVAPPELSQSGAPWPHSLGSKCKDFVWWHFERHFQDYPVPLLCSTLFTVKKVVAQCK